MPIDDKRFILVMTAGTSDIPVAKVAREAIIFAHFFDKGERKYQLFAH